ncbi:helix-turn-helix domain-containing protein [Verrucomicrobia bacterium]|nr:helix-turn-helix domain-containing protein [Verrucomicrobiota bacterium]
MDDNEKHEQSSSSKELISKLRKSQVFKDFQQSFTTITGLPLALCPVESWQLPFHETKQGSPFCRLMAGRNGTCANCLQIQQKLDEAAEAGPATVTCPSGLCDSVVVVRLGKETIGYLKTGQVFHEKPTAREFTNTIRHLSESSVTGNKEEYRTALFATTVVPADKYQAAIEMLRIFANHLSMISNQIQVQEANSEPPMITRAKSFIRLHCEENLTLSRVAKAVHTSPFYFCKQFKKGTGIKFTEYVSRIRIENARQLLLDPNRRISEVAIDVGFQSLTHFNRVFKKFFGHSPSEYRTGLATY